MVHPEFILYGTSAQSKSPQQLYIYTPPFFLNLLPLKNPSPSGLFCDSGRIRWLDARGVCITARDKPKAPGSSGLKLLCCSHAVFC